MTTEDFQVESVNILKDIQNLLLKSSIFLENLDKRMRPSEDLITGQKTVAVAGTAEQLFQGIVPCRRVIVQAFFSNTDNVAVGRQGVLVSSSTTASGSSTDKGRTLAAGQAEIFNIFDASMLWINAAANGEGVNYVIEKDNN